MYDGPFHVTLATCGGLWDCDCLHLLTLQEEHSLLTSPQIVVYEIGYGIVFEVVHGFYEIFFKIRSEFSVRSTINFFPKTTVIKLFTDQSEVSLLHAWCI